MWKWAIKVDISLEMMMPFITLALGDNMEASWFMLTSTTHKVGPIVAASTLVLPGPGNFLVVKPHLHLWAEKGSEWVSVGVREREEEDICESLWKMVCRQHVLWLCESPYR